jgi:hypothetical protein
MFYTWFRISSKSSFFRLSLFGTREFSFIVTFLLVPIDFYLSTPFIYGGGGLGDTPKSGGADNLRDDSLLKLNSNVFSPSPPSYYLTFAFVVLLLFFGRTSSQLFL